MHVIVRRAGISFGALVLLIVLLAATVYVASERRVNAKVIPGSLARARADAQRTAPRPQRAKLRDLGVPRFRHASHFFNSPPTAASRSP